MADMTQMLKRLLYNQQQILENQQLLLGEVKNLYDPNRSEVNKVYCESLQRAITESEESIKLTCETLG